MLFPHVLSPVESKMKNQFIQGVLSLTARVMIAAVFLLSAVGNKIPKFNDVTRLMESEGVPLPQVMLVGAIVFLIGGSLSVIAGYKTKTGAAMLLVFLVLATYFFHDFWSYTAPAAKQEQMIAFMKNLSLAGAMLFIIANGPGPMSLDGAKAKKGWLGWLKG